MWSKKGWNRNVCLQTLRLWYDGWISHFLRIFLICVINFIKISQKKKNISNLSNPNPKWPFKKMRSKKYHMQLIYLCMKYKKIELQCFLIVIRYSITSRDLVAVKKLQNSREWCGFAYRFGHWFQNTNIYSTARGGIINEKKLKFLPEKLKQVHNWLKLCQKVSCYDEARFAKTCWKTSTYIVFVHFT